MRHILLFIIIVGRVESIHPKRQLCSLMTIILLLRLYLLQFSYFVSETVREIADGTRLCGARLPVLGGDMSHLLRLVVNTGCSTAMGRGDRREIFIGILGRVHVIMLDLPTLLVLRSLA